MVGGKYKSRKYRKIYKKTPGGRTAIHYMQRKAGMVGCAKCGSTIKGIKNVFASREGALPKSDKRINRIFGGSLCSRCSRIILKARAREL